MTDGTFNPGDLLSGLAANPELLKNAMQMASALASSGALNGLFGGGGSTEANPQKTATAASASAPPSGGFADLLAGLMNGSAPSGAPKSDPAAASVSSVPSSAPMEHGRKGRPVPCHQDRVQLLQSICPFLPEEKREKVQFLIKLLGLFNAAESMGLGRLF